MCMWLFLKENPAGLAILHTNPRRHFLLRLMVISFLKWKYLQSPCLFSGYLSSIVVYFTKDASLQRALSTPSPSRNRRKKQSSSSICHCQVLALETHLSPIYLVHCVPRAPSPKRNRALQICTS